MAPPPLNAPGESEKDMIDRIMGRKKQSMSDAPGGLMAGQMYAQAEPMDPRSPALASWRPTPEQAARLLEFMRRAPGPPALSDLDKPTVGQTDMMHVPRLIRQNIQQSLPGAQEEGMNALRFLFQQAR
jgi:hypothetical protein